jgi:hypothetical protein
MTKNWHNARYLLSGCITHVLRVHDGGMVRLRHNASGEGPASKNSDPRVCTHCT